MTMQLYCYGYEMIIRSDRLEEASEWLEDEFGDGGIFDGAEHRNLGDGTLALDLGDVGDEGPFWGDVPYGTYDSVEKFFEEYACAGSYFNFVTDYGDTLVLLSADQNGVHEETVKVQDVFGMLRERRAEQMRQRGVKECAGLGAINASYVKELREACGLAADDDIVDSTVSVIYERFCEDMDSFWDILPDGYELDHPRLLAGNDEKARGLVMANPTIKAAKAAQMKASKVDAGNAGIKQ